MNVSLTPDLEELVRKKIESGQYQSASHVVGEALRLLDAYDSVRADALAKLRTDVEVGWQDVEHGRISDFDPADIKRRGRERLARDRNSRQ